MVKFNANADLKMSVSNQTVGTTQSRTSMPFGLFDDERPHSKRATRDAVVRLTRLATPELEEIAKGGGVHEQLLLNAQSTTAAKDALESLVGSKQVSRGGGDRLGHHETRRRMTNTDNGFRTLSGTSPPESPSSFSVSSDSLVSPMRQNRPSTPPTPLWKPDELLRTGGPSCDLTYHSGSADTLPSKARALLERHSFYSAGTRSYDNQRPRDFTVLGEHREVRESLGSRRKYRMRSVKPSRCMGTEEQDLKPGEIDRSGEEERILRVKQMVKMVMSAQGPKSKSQLERSFRMADKDGSGELDFDELNFSLRNDFAIKGMTPGDVTRIFNSMDEDKSGFVSTEEFVNAIDSVPFPELKNQVGFQTLPSPHTLKTRQSFQVWPTTFDLGMFQYRSRESKKVELKVRNVGYSELRFRVHITSLAAGQKAKVLEQPRGLMAPGLRGKIVVEFSSDVAGSLTALLTIESAEQVCEIPVIGTCSDGHEKIDELFAHLPSSSGGGSETIRSTSTTTTSQSDLDSASLLTALKYSRANEKRKKMQEEEQRRGDNGAAVIQTISSSEGWFGETRQSFTPECTTDSQQNL